MDKMNNIELRRIPLEGEFMQKKINDIVYGYLQTISYKDKEDKRFVYKDAINYSELEKKFGYDDNGKPFLSRLKITRAINVLKAYGFVEEGKVVDLYNKKVPAFFLPYDETNPFQLIPNTTLKFLVDTSNSNVIKIYAYLLNKYLWKEKTKEKYIFSNKELILLLGMKSSTNQRDYDMINNILTSLHNNGLIYYSEYYEKRGDKIIPRKKLISASYAHKEVQ